MPCPGPLRTGRASRPGIRGIMLHRRPTRDYEILPASPEAMIHVASTDNLTKRITDESTPTWQGTHQKAKGNSPSAVPRDALILVSG